jgi:hypothetical protein
VQDSYQKAMEQSATSPSEHRPNYERAMLPFTAAEDDNQQQQQSPQPLQRLTAKKRQDSYLQAIGQQSPEDEEYQSVIMPKSPQSAGSKRSWQVRQDSYTAAIDTSVAYEQPAAQEDLLTTRHVRKARRQGRHSPIFKNYS